VPFSIGVGVGLTSRLGAGNSLAAIKANAQKIIAARQSFTTRTVMSTPPTLTSAASSTISSSNDGASANSISLTDTTKIRTVGPVDWKNSGAHFIGIKGEYSHYPSANGEYFGGSGWSYEFVHTGAQFEIADNPWANWRIRMLVMNADGSNPQWASAAHWSKADFGNPADGFRVLKFNFGTSATRRIRVYNQFDQNPAWVNIAAGNTIALPALAAGEPLSRYWGDSYVEAPFAYQTGYDVAATTPLAICEQLGVSMPVPAGRSAQGFTNPVDSLTFATRMADDVARIPPRVHEIVQCSINDNAASAAAVTAAVTQGLQNLRAGAPETCITVILPFTFDANPTPPAIYAANKAGAQAVAANDPGIVIIETSDLPSINNGGTLPNAATQVSFDGIHPGMAWNNYVAPIIAGRVVAAWQTFAALTSFDPAATNANITLSNGNLTATQSVAGNYNTRSTSSRSSGLLYCEMVRNSGTSAVGFANASNPTTEWGGSTNNSIALDTASGLVYAGGASQGSAGLGTIANGNVIGMAWNRTTGKCWFSKNGTYGSGQDPVAGTGGFIIPVGAHFITASPYNGGSVTIRTEIGQFTGSPPTGFSPWN
jgi:hypothetical protein